MYQTRISRVSGKLCVDEMGRTLERIGNLNVNAGDAVWTDGRVIYGNECGGAEMPMLFGSAEAAIPLNAMRHYLLFLYRRGRGIEAYAMAKGSCAFANNASQYCLGRARNEVADMDIGRDGRPWSVITLGAAYWRKTPVEFWAHSRGGDEKGTLRGLADFFYDWDVYQYKYHIYERMTYTSAAHPERNADEESHTDKSMKTNDPARSSSLRPFLRFGEEETADSPVRVTHGTEATDTLNLDVYAEKIKAYWRELLGTFGGSGRWQDTIEEITCMVPDARIDEKGNYSLVVVAKVSGYCFKDVRVGILSLVRTIRKETTDTEPYEMTMQGEHFKWDTRRVAKVTDETVVGSETSVRTIPGTLSCELRFLVTRDGAKEIARSHSYDTPLKLGDQTYSSDGGTYQYGQLAGNGGSVGPLNNTYTVWEGSASIAGLGTFMGGYTSEEYPPVSYPPKTLTPYTVKETTAEKEEYEMPIQDGYVCRNSDYKKVYKGGSLVAEVNFDVCGIVALDARKKEYLLLRKSDGMVALYRNGTVTFPEAAAYRATRKASITTTNTRLRWMRALSRLKS